MPPSFSSEYFERYMVHLRATRAVLNRLKLEPVEAAPSANALGDWCVHRFVWRRQALLICMSQTSRLTILDSSRELSGFPVRFRGLVQLRLEALGVSDCLIRRELCAMGQTVVARANDRGTLSAINQFLVCAEPSLDHFDGHLPAVQAQLGRTLTQIHGGQYLRPDEEARALLTAAAQGGGAPSN